jgi:hypothetical protein
MVDLQYGGMNGYAPDLTEWVSNQSYIRKNVIPLLVEAPRGFQYLPNPESYVATLRALVELHALSIEGLNAGLEVSVEETAVGGGGQMQQDFTDVKEARSNPVIRWNEKYGMPVSTFFRNWITNLMMDPHSKVAGIATLGVAPEDMLADMYSATMIFIEPDPTHTRVMKSWLVTNMFPQSSGEIVGSRDLTQPGQPVTYDINFTGIAQFGLGVDQFAQTLLDGINITGANPNNRAAFVQGISADIAAARASYATNVDTLARTAVPV